MGQVRALSKRRLRSSELDGGNQNTVVVGLTILAIAIGLYDLLVLLRH